jgi:uncharacterized LabA/DUF88 family protein
MDILVDYNNIHETDRHKGVRFVLDKIVSAIGPKYLASENRATFRLYDGWYEAKHLTHQAQHIAAHLLRDFPTTRTIKVEGRKRTLIVNAELAYSLKLAPTRHLWYTYRQRQTAGNVKCRHPSDVGCTSSHCPLISVFHLFTTGRCPEAGCSARLSDVVYRSEQKLVDTMLVADLFYLAFSRIPTLAVVSSDDDIWPAILAATQLGATVIQIHTRTGYSTRPYYCQGLGNRYVQLAM